MAFSESSSRRFSSSARSSPACSAMADLAASASSQARLESQRAVSAVRFGSDIQPSICAFTLSIPTPTPGTASGSSTSYGTNTGIPAFHSMSLFFM